ncbi:S8 family peptidase [Verrucomicrobiota bacterium sgz303538]
MLPRFLAVVLLLIGWCGGTAFAQTSTLKIAKARQDRILVKFKPGAAPAGDERPHGRVFRRFEALGIEVIQLDGTAPADQVLTEYRADARVVYAQPDYIRSKQMEPNDPGTPDGDSWHLANDGRDLGKLHADIAAPAAWDVRHDAEDVVVAVLDTGIRYTHEDLAANMWRNPGEANGQEGVDDDGDGIIDDIYGANLVDNTGVPMDDEGHGTFIAGLIGAVGNNSKGVTGVCWKVKLMAVKVLDANGSGSDSDIIAGLEYARQHGAKIINASLGRGGDVNLAMEDAIIALGKSGVILVAAAGNSSFNNDFDLKVSQYPASSPHPNVVTVAATTRNDLLAVFSNYGWRSVDLGAPGVDVPSTSAESDTSYDVESGTSISAPLVTGALALMTAHLPDLTPLQRIARMLDAVDPVPALSGKCASGGRLNVRRALDGGSVAPVNDRFARALPLGSDIYFAGTSVCRGASTEPEAGEYTTSRRSSDPARRSLWWTWTAPYTGRVIIEAARNREPYVEDRSIVVVYQGTSLSNLRLTGGNADSGTLYPVRESAIFDAVYGQTYYICAESATRDNPIGFSGRYDLAPNGYGEYTVLSIDSYGPGSVTPAKLLGESIQRRGEKITLRAVPAPGYILYGWVNPAAQDPDERILSREPVYSFTLPDTGVTAVQAVFSFNPFRDLKGHYNGLITPESGASGAGFLSMDLGVSGAFTGSLRIGNSTYRLKGTLRSDREFTSTIKRLGSLPLTLTFKLDYERRITGSVTGDGSGTYTLLAEAGGFSIRDNPTISAGRYTVLLPTGDATAGQPAGAGYGLLMISPAGNIRFSGVLGDGQKASQGATLYRTGHWPFFATPYKSGGAIAGTVAFDEDAPESDLTGTLTWNKVQKTTDKVYPEGFQNVRVELTGSRYDTPVPGERIIPVGSETNNAFVSIDGEGFVDRTFFVTVDASNSVTASGNFDMAIFPIYGEFAARFVENNRPFLLHGMVSRKAGRGMGYMISGKESARVTFEPTN